MFRMHKKIVINLKAQVNGEKIGTEKTWFEKTKVS